MEFIIKRITDKNDIKTAFGLAEKVFMQFEAPQFSERGVKSFLSFLWGERVRDMLDCGELIVWVCLADGETVGMLALRACEHISLAFVKADFHRQGIGRMLYSEAKKYAAENGAEYITVNASDYGIPFYRAMGFSETDMQLMTEGIIYTPMRAEL